MPMPVTVWFAPSVLLSQACSSATGITASTPTSKPSKPSNGLPVYSEAMAPAKAPVSIIPSTLMFSTPARSLTSSPVAASNSGSASRRLDPMNTASISSVIWCFRGRAASTPPRPASR